MKLAVASKDGTTITCHFGQAETFEIFSLEGSTLQHLETRKVDKYASEQPTHTFNEQRFAKVLDALEDCSLVYCRKIGETPKKILSQNNIETIIGFGDIAAIAR